MDTAERILLCKPAKGVVRAASIALSFAPLAGVTGITDTLKQIQDAVAELKARKVSAVVIRAIKRFK
jgi:hypothetical protein